MIYRGNSLMLIFTLLFTTLVIKAYKNIEFTKNRTTLLLYFLTQVIFNTIITIVYILCQYKEIKTKIDHDIYLQVLLSILFDSKYILLDIAILCFKRNKDILVSFSKLNDESVQIKTIYH